MTSSELETRIRELWHFDDPDASASVFEHQSDLASGDEQVIWLSQVARAHGLAGRFDEGHALLDSLDAPSLGTHAQARIAIERGRLHNSAGATAEAAQDFEAAYSLASQAELDGLAVDALHMTAIVIGQINGPEAALGSTLAALEFARSSADPNATRWIPSLLNNLGWTQHDLGDFESALDSFEQALDARRAQDASATELLIAEWSIARTLRSLGRHEEALAIQERLATEPAGAEDGYVAEEIAACLSALGRPDEAAPWSDRATALLGPNPS